MAALYFTGTSPTGKSLTLAPMTSRRAAALDPQPIDWAGYFLFEACNGGERVIARVDDDEAAFSLAGLLGIG